MYLDGTLDDASMLLLLLPKLDELKQKRIQIEQLIVDVEQKVQYLRRIR